MPNYLIYLFAKQKNYDYLCTSKRHNHSGYAQPKKLFDL
jgi:hypothetical protein